jgi:hypothetical protein
MYMGTFPSTIKVNDNVSSRFFDREEHFFQKKLVGIKYIS